MITNGVQEVSISLVRHSLIPENCEKFEGLFEATSISSSSNFAGYVPKKVSELENDSIYRDEMLLSDRYKIIWTAQIGLYNLYYCAFPQLMEMVNNTKDAIVLINSSQMSQEANMPHFTFILDWLDSNGVEWQFFNDPPKSFYIRNFYKAVNQITKTEDIDNVYDFANSFIENKNVEPFRKVYVSRRHIETRDYSFIMPGLTVYKDDRLNDHDVLELFLEKNGFEVIIPEQKFTNFKDQIEYFNQTKLLVSLSSSGISNSLFMQPKTTVVEFMTLYPTPSTGPDYENPENKVSGYEGIHHLYHAQAYLKNHNYVAIPNQTRMSDDIINKIESNDWLRTMFIEETK